MAIELADVNKAIIKAKRQESRLKKKPVVVAAERLPMPVAIQKTEPSRPKSEPQPVSPTRIVCPLAITEQCLYGFFTNLCRYCRSFRYMLDNMPFMLPESAAVEIIRGFARDDALEDFLGLIKSELEIDNDSITSFGKELAEEIELQLPENGLEGLSLNQLEIIRAIILLKNEPGDSIILQSLRLLMADRYDIIETNCNTISSPG